MGKGSVRRPQEVSGAVMKANWEKAFPREPGEVLKRPTGKEGGWRAYPCECVVRGGSPAPPTRLWAGKRQCLRCGKTP